MDKEGETKTGLVNFFLQGLNGYPLTPYQDGVFSGNGVAYVFMSEVAQYYVSENTCV